MPEKISAPKHQSYMASTIAAKHRGKSKNSTMSPVQRGKERIELIKKRCEEGKKREVETLENSMSNFKAISMAAEQEYYNWVYQRNKEIINYKNR